MRRKKEMGEHVELSTETKDKLLSAVSSEPRYIAPWDIIALMMSEAEAAKAQMRGELALSEATVLRLTAQLANARAELTRKDTLETARKAQEAHRILADGLAERYGFTWHTHSYNPETGEIVESSPG